MVDDVSHIGLVDTHAERIGGHDHRHLVGDEVVLRRFTRVRRHAAMVGDRRVPHLVQRSCERLGGLAGGTVDDAGFVRVGSHIVRHPRGLVFGFQLDHVEIQVRPVESGDGDGRIPQTQQSHDVAAHALGGGGGECADRRTLGQADDEVANTKV